MLKGFKEFILRGNVIDLAVAFVAGAAFTAVVGSFTEGLINPAVGLILGGGIEAGTVTVNGQVFNFTLIVNALITFVLTMFVLYFVFVLPMNKYRERTAPPSEPAGPTEVELLQQIKELLEKRTS